MLSSVKVSPVAELATKSITSPVARVVMILPVNNLFSLAGAFKVIELPSISVLFFLTNTVISACWELEASNK